jgi:hypothetical protein
MSGKGARAHIQRRCAADHRNRRGCTPADGFVGELKRRSSLQTSAELLLALVHSGLRRYRQPSPFAEALAQREVHRFVIHPSARLPMVKSGARPYAHPRTAIDVVIRVRFADHGWMVKVRYTPQYSKAICHVVALRAFLPFQNAATPACSQWLRDFNSPSHNLIRASMLWRAALRTSCSRCGSSAVAASRMAFAAGPC